MGRITRLFLRLNLASRLFLIVAATTLALSAPSVIADQQQQSNLASEHLSNPNSPQNQDQAVRTNSRTQVSVMAPLSRIQNWNAFAARLATLKANGVDALTTDIWWGIFEAAGDNQFDWSYYLQYAEVVKNSGLKWTPILSFHQCGGNVGDDCNIPIPSWIWGLGSSEEMVYKNEDGQQNLEYVAPFFDGVYPQYAEAMAAFGRTFSRYGDLITKVYISMGPASELRYPSYVNSLGWSYPQRGKLNAHSGAAIDSFRKAMLQRYGDLESINRAWGISLSSIEQIGPPTDGDNFFINGIYTKYGDDFLRWYQGVLESHLDSMLGLANRNLIPQLPNAKLGVKLAGIHWLHNSSLMPRAAEKAAGYYNYRPILERILSHGAELTYTCLEMDDADKWRAPFFSAPKTLVNEMSELARSVGVSISGENALAIQNDRRRYQEIRDVLTRHNYTAFTLLRINNIVDEQGRATGEMAPFREEVIDPLN